MRKIRLPAIVLSVAVWSAALVAPGAEQPKPDAEGFTAIFNGRDMAGWAGKPGWWSVDQGALTAQSTVEKPCKKHNYLMWRGAATGDFELKLRFRITGGNSGVQFRSRELPGWDIAGYQADIDQANRWTGCLYDVNTGRGAVSMRGEKTRIDADGQKHVAVLGDPAELARAIKKNDWNEYHITARGSHIVLAINGVVMTEVTDNQEDKASKKGIFAFQMHPGPPMKVQFKDIRLKRLD